MYLYVDKSHGQCLYHQIFGVDNYKDIVFFLYELFLNS